MKSKLLKAAVAAVTLTFAANAVADEATENLMVSASVGQACQVAADTLPFGAVDILDPDDVDAMANISVLCNLSTAYTVALDGGQNADDIRQMAGSNGGFLKYSLYFDSNRTGPDLWGDGNFYGNVVEGEGDGGSIVHTVYGRIESTDISAVNLPAGDYADIVQITVTF